MTTKINRTKWMKVVVAGMLALMAPLSSLVFTACSDDDSDQPLNFYSSVRLTAAGLIESNPGQFSDFQNILERSNYLSVLKTYGHFTVFAPTNEAIQTYLSENGYPSLESLPTEVCDTLSRIHIVQDKAYFTTDMGGEIPPVNMNEDYIEMTSDSDVYNNNALLIYVNKTSRIIEKDDSVTNGVVHVIDRVINSSSQFLPSIIEDNPELSLFAAALRLTGMADSLMKYNDDTYTVSPDSAWDGGTSKGFWKINRTGGDGTGATTHTWYPQYRQFKFTAFVEPDSVYHAHGINTIDDLKDYAKRIYDESYPDDAGKYDEDFKDRRNPLNRFVSYHLIDRTGPRDYWVHCRGTIYTSKMLYSVADPEDYYETLAPHTIIRFSSIPGEEIFINRVGLKANYTYRGVRVYKNEESGDAVQTCKNGRYIYIDDLLVYSKEVREKVLNRRIRIDGSTLSPDFMNGHARMEHMGRSGDPIMIGFKQGYLANFKFYNPNTFVGCGNEQPTWVHYMGSGVCFTGEKYDVSVKLPPVPYSGTWEVRMGYSQGDDRGIAQVYLNNDPCGLPVSFRMFDSEYTTARVPDANLTTDEIMANDKSLRNLGFMKAMDSYGDNSGNGSGTSFRENATNTCRRILVRQYMSSEEEYWLRFRQILEGSTLYMSLDYIELCPKDVFDNPAGEDWH